MVNDRPPQHGDLYAERGACLNELYEVYNMGQVWFAVVQGSEAVRWQKWSPLDYVTTVTPKVKVRKGAGIAGEAAPYRRDNPKTPHLRNWVRNVGICLGSRAVWAPRGVLGPNNP